MQYSIIEGLSDKLKKELKDAAPKKGQVVRFSMINGVAGNRKVGARLHFSNREGFSISDEGEDGPVRRNINLIAGYRPGRDGGQEEVPGEIEFSPQNFGLVYCKGDNAEDLEKFYFLYLHPCREGNVNAWYRGTTKKARFRMDMPEKTASGKVQSLELKTKAFIAIQEMSEKELLQAIKGFSITGVNEYSTNDELRLALYEKVGEKDPARILNIGSDREFSIKALINQAVDDNVIALEGNEWLMVASGEPIYRMIKGEEPKEVLALFLEDKKGHELKKSIKKQLNGP